MKFLDFLGLISIFEILGIIWIQGYYGYKIPPPLRLLSICDAVVNLSRNKKYRIEIPSECVRVVTSFDRCERK